MMDPRHVSLRLMSILTDDMADDGVSCWPSGVSVSLTVDSILLSDRVLLMLTTLQLLDNWSWTVTV